MRTKLLPYCLTLCDPWTGSPTRLLCSWDSPGNKTGVGCHSLFQRIFPTRQDPSLLCLLFWQACSLPLAPPGNKQMLSNNRHSITLRILGVRTRLSFGDTSIHSHKKNGKSSPTAVFDSIFFYETLCKFSVWPWLQGTDFQKQMWRLLLISWWKKENSIPFTSLYMFRNVRRKKKKKELLKGKLWLPLSYLPSPYLLFPTLLFFRTFTLLPFWQRASLHLLHLPSTSCHQCHQHLHLSLVHSSFHQSLPPQYWSFACLSHWLMSIGTRSLENCFPSPNVM